MGDLTLDKPTYLGDKTSSTAMSFSDYYFGKRNYEPPKTNIQKTDNGWIHNKIDLNALLVHQEDAPPATVNHAEEGTKREPTGMACIFTHLATVV